MFNWWQLSQPSYLHSITMDGHLLLLFLLPLSSATPFPSHQQALLTTLFSPDYNPLFIPVKNESVHQEVFLEATLQKIIDFDMDKVDRNDKDKNDDVDNDDISGHPDHLDLAGHELGR